jgi:predicted MFS family arabinose efflux permease
MEEIMQHFHIDAGAFAMMASFYYLGYAGMQVPIGILLDRYGVRYVVSACALITVAGNLPFIFSDDWGYALVGRFFIGLGSAAGALGAIKAVRINFDHSRVSKMIGWTITIGLIGAINGTTINNYLIELFGMQKALLYLALPGVLVAIAVLFFIRDLNEEEGEIREGKVWQGVLSVMSNPQLVMIALCGALLVGPLEAFADIWGVPFFTKVYGFSRVDAGYLSTSAIYFGMCVGSPLLATIVDKFQSHYVMNIIAGAVMAAAYYVLLNKLVTSYYVIFAITFTVGVMCAYQVIVFATVTDIVPPYLSGIAISLVNMINMAAGSAFHFAVGYSMDSYWTGDFLNGTKTYSAEAYTDSLFILPITLVLGTIGFILIKPKKGIC